MRLSSLARLQKSAVASVRPTAKPFHFPAPIGGWNSRDPAEKVPLNDALTLQNLFPTTSDLRMREGLTVFCTLPSAGFVNTLMTYQAAVSPKMFAVNLTSGAGVIYDITSGTASSVMTGLTNADLMYVNFTTSGGSYIVAVTGVDSMIEYDGTTWTLITGVSTPAITGVTTSNLSNVFVFKKRLFFIEKNKLKVWHLAVDSISGAATGFDVSAQFKKGGYLMVGGSFTRDGGDGLDDIFVVVSSKGEVLMYQGTDPATDFVLMGRYDIPEPLGPRCMMKYGSDLLVMTKGGIIPLGQVLSIDTSKQEIFAISDKIRNAFAWMLPTGVIPSPAYHGVSIPLGTRLMFNMYSVFFVQNSLTSAWCMFYGMTGGYSTVLFNDTLYLSATGKVLKSDATVSYDMDSSGNQQAISIVWSTPYSALDGSIGSKHVTSVRYDWSTYADFRYTTSVYSDFSIGGLVGSSLAGIFAYPIINPGIPTFLSDPLGASSVSDVVDASYVGNPLGTYMRFRRWRPVTKHPRDQVAGDGQYISVTLGGSQISAGTGDAKFNLIVYGLDIMYETGAPT